MTLQAAKEDIQKIIFGMNLVHFNQKKLLCVFQVLDQIKRRMTKNPPPPKKKKKEEKGRGVGGGGAGARSAMVSSADCEADSMFKMTLAVTDLYIFFSNFVYLWSIHNKPLIHSASSHAFAWRNVFLLRECVRKMLTSETHKN